MLARLSGHSADLLSYDHVVGKLRLSGQSPGGLRQIPIQAIVGSVGRYQDFSRTFLPRLESDQDRWVSVGAAAPAIGDLPPIDVYKLGENYFVLDGNHRVSVARQQGLDYIDAYVIDVRTRVPLPPGARPDDLIIAAEYGAFLEYTRLDLNRANVDMRVSVPGQYHHLENHIEAYRYRLENDSGQELTIDQAAAQWYDEAYLPFVLAIRQQGILRYFPGRTETDFFVWLSRHRLELESELGRSVSPGIAVARLLPRVQATERSATPRRSPLRRLTQLVAPERAAPPVSWAAERTVDRYADHLFANVLAPIVAGDGEERALAVLDRAVDVCLTEGAQLTVLVMFAGSDEPAVAAPLRARLAVESAARGLVAELDVDSGDPAGRAVELAFVNDLVVLDRVYSPAAPDEPAPTAAARRVLSRASRPLLFIGPDAQSGPPRRALLVHDTRRKFDEAVFLAAYLGERWRVQLAALPLSNGRNTAAVVSRVGDYLALHEVSAGFLEPARVSAGLADRIVAAAHETAAELIILPGPSQGNNNHLDEVIVNVLRRWPNAVMVAC